MTPKGGKPHRRKPMAMALALVLACLALSGCAAVGPDYSKPQTPMPQSWKAQADPAVIPDGAMVRDWWELFNDPLLNRLIALTEKQNLGLLAAVARVDEARARLCMATGERLPSLEAGGSVMRTGGSENSTGHHPTETYYRAGGAASWEIDLFGRVRRSVEAAAADYQASREDRVDVMITLFAEVARTYVKLRTLQARLASARANIASQKQVLELTRSRLRFGLGNSLDVAQAERVLASSEAEVPPLRIELAHAINAMAVLMGRHPGDFFELLESPKPIPMPPEKVTVGLPVVILRQRPDIRRAERRLAAQTARIGVATAELYPRFALLGSLGLEAIDTEDLFDASSRVFSFGPSLRWRIFEGGRIRSQIKVRGALARQALLNYEQSVLSALSEVENALAAYLQQRIRHLALERSVVASRRSLRLSTNLYQRGLVEFQNVLDAQRALFSLENQMAEAKGGSAANFIGLYRALGGGWDPANPPGDQAAPGRSAGGNKRKVRISQNEKRG